MCGGKTDELLATDDKGEESEREIPFLKGSRSRRARHPSRRNTSSDPPDDGRPGELPCRSASLEAVVTTAITPSFYGTRFAARRGAAAAVARIRAICCGVGWGGVEDSRVHLIAPFLSLIHERVKKPAPSLISTPRAPSETFELSGALRAIELKVRCTRSKKPLSPKYVLVMYLSVTHQPLFSRLLLVGFVHRSPLQKRNSTVAMPP